MESKQYKINMPSDVKEWLKREAEKNLRSQSNEIILALREKMAAGETPEENIKHAE